jgi:hypothetical protein
LLFGKKRKIEEIPQKDTQETHLDSVGIPVVAVKSK